MNHSNLHIRLNCLTRTHGKGDPCPHCEKWNQTETTGIADRAEKKRVVMENLQLQLEALALSGCRAQRKMELTMAREIPCDLWMSDGF